MSRAGEILNGPYLGMRKALDTGLVSSVDLTRESLARAKASQPKINAFISIAENEALKEAAAADIRLRAGERGPLLGCPVAVKDLILTQGLRTTAASKMLEGFTAPYDATVVTKLKRAGAAIIGKTNLDEFAMGSSNETSFFGATRNPWDVSRVPGGSSGGSAACVAARVTPLSLGTDTGGSIRQPAALTGITGLKPTYGRVSRYGVVAFASSLDQAGPMCADAEGCAAVMNVIAGADIHDATSANRNVPDFLEGLDGTDLRGLRIGLPREFFGEGLGPEVQKTVNRALDVFNSLGVKTVEVSLPHTRYSLPAYYIICTSEASSNLARYDGIHYGHRSAHSAAGSIEDLYANSRGEGFGEEVRLRVLLGTYALSSGYYEAYYRKASQVRALIKKDFDDAFTQCDVVAGPTSPTTAFKLGEKFGNPLSMYLADMYTLSTNLAGIPGLSLNAGFDSKGLPVGLQLLGPRWQDARLLKLAAAFQEVMPETLELSPLAKSFPGGRA